jgi:RNA polymerase sigma-70 factor, ECF subfamily
MSLTRQQRFETLAAEVAGPVLRYALRRTDPDTAEDVLADTLLVAWRRIDDVPDGAELPWCYAVARNQLANAARSAKRQRNLIARIVRLDRPDEATSAAELPDPALHAALQQLRPEDQELLRLSAWEDLAPAEIATVLGVSPNAVSIRLHRARKRLAEILSGEQGGEQGKDGPPAGQELDETGGTR